jgi:acyl-CoA thioesterase
MTPSDLANACAESMYASDRASQHLGIRIEITAAGSALARMTIRDDMVNGFGVCHGGMIFALADSAFAFACNAYDEVTVAAGASIEFVRAASAGDTLSARATEVQRGRRRGVYDVEVRDQEDRLVAVFRGRSAALGRPILTNRQGPAQSDT